MDIEKLNTIEEKLDQIIEVQKKQERRAKFWIAFKFLWTIVLIVLFVILPIYFTYQLIEILDINALLENFNKILDSIK